MMKLSHFFFLILIPVLYSCSSDEHYLDFTIEKQDIKIAKAFWEMMMNVHRKKN